MKLADRLQQEIEDYNKLIEQIQSCQEEAQRRLGGIQLLQTLIADELKEASKDAEPPE